MARDLPSGLRARLDPAERFGLRLSLVGLAIVLVAVPFTTLLFQVMGDGSLTRLDGRVADDLNAWVHRHPVVEPTLHGLSLLGRPPVLAVWVVAGVLWCWRHGRRRAATFLAVTPLGGGIVSTVVKLAVDRPRPVVDHPITTAFGKSFPSGHAMSSTVAYGALVVAFLPLLHPRARRWIVAAAAALVLAIGLSRLLLGVHFVTDVVGGFVLGLAWLAGSAAAFHTWKVEDLDRQRRRLRLAAPRRPPPEVPA